MIERWLRRSPQALRAAQRIYRWLQPLRERPLRTGVGYVRLFQDWRKFRRLGGQASLADFYPCLFDRVSTTPIDPQYFYQAAWAMRLITALRPAQHVDIGSDVRYVGMLSQCVPTTFVDIRPLQVQLPGLDCRIGSVLALPYPDASVMSISCLHVIEHVGLGRYGDPLDPQGTAKACRELQRVLARGGRLYVSTPVGRARVQFNGQRVQSVEEVLQNFSGLTPVIVSLIDPEGMFHDDIGVDRAAELAVQDGYLDYALGCFVFMRLPVAE